MTDLTEIHLRRTNERIDKLMERVEALEKRYVELVEKVARLETKGAGNDSDPKPA